MDHNTFSRHPTTQAYRPNNGAQVTYTDKIELSLKSRNLRVLYCYLLTYMILHYEGEFGKLRQRCPLP